MKEEDKILLEEVEANYKELKRSRKREERDSEYKKLMSNFFIASSFYYNLVTMCVMLAIGFFSFNRTDFKTEGSLLFIIFLICMIFLGYTKNARLFIIDITILTIMFCIFTLTQNKDFNTFTYFTSFAFVIIHTFVLIVKGFLYSDIKNKKIILNKDKNRKEVEEMKNQFNDIFESVLYNNSVMFELLSNEDYQEIVKDKSYEIDLRVREIERNQKQKKLRLDKIKAFSQEELIEEESFSNKIIIK